eukprot:110844-Alexandrium_andersonii.AAC.1
MPQTSLLRNASSDNKLLNSAAIHSIFPKSDGDNFPAQSKCASGPGFSQWCRCMMGRRAALNTRRRRQKSRLPSAASACLHHFPSLR